MAEVFIDTNVPMYAAGTEHPLRAPAQRIILSLVDRQLDGATDTETFQEILYRYFAIGDRQKGVELFDTFHRIMVGRILAVADPDLLRARSLADRYPALSPRDLIHLGVMLGSQIEQIITADRGFDRVREVRRIPLESFAGNLSG